MMNHAVILLFISSLCVVFATVFYQYFRQPETMQTLSRSRHLDGLRGILACCVVAHHSYYTFLWREGGSWGGTDNTLIINLGAVSVSLFFMMSAYLHVLNIFRSPNINWYEFYWARAKRIYPVYLLVMLAVIALTIHFRRIDTHNFVQFVQFLGEWLLFQNAQFQGFQAHLVIAGVQWTLVYEWGMYAVLPVIHMIFHRKICFQAAAWLAIGVAWFIGMHSALNTYWIFVMALPAFLFSKQIQLIIQKYPKLIHFLMLPLTAYIFIATPAYSWEQKGLLMVWFMCVVHGYNFFNLLNLYGLVKLGNMSYSVYLIHGWVLFMWFGVWKMFAFRHGDFMAYAWHLPVIFAVTFVLAHVSWRYVEMPLARKNLFQAA